MSKIAVSIVGASGYVGGELLRLALYHPNIELRQVTSQRYAGQPIGRAHPNLRRRAALTFTTPEALKDTDTLFLCLPHGQSMERIDAFRARADRIIDLSADFRLTHAADFSAWYGRAHTRPDLLGRFVYGIPELHRERMRGATLVSSAGCNATATILGLYPLYRADLVSPAPTVVEVKVGSSEAGNAPSAGSHHPERAGCVRSFMPTRHRHTAEIVQELSLIRQVRVHFSATALDQVRGVLATCHVELKEELDEREIWKVYREHYGNEPFIRIVRERQGIYRYPEPKLLAGTNGCDIGFERDPHSRRLVVISAIDNLMKGAAGQALQAFNIIHGLNERIGLEFPGLHP